MPICGHPAWSTSDKHAGHKLSAYACTVPSARSVHAGPGTWMEVAMCVAFYDVFRAVSACLNGHFRVLRFTFDEFKQRSLATTTALGYYHAQLSTAKRVHIATTNRSYSCGVGQYARSKPPWRTYSCASTRCSLRCRLEVHFKPFEIG